VDVTCATDSDSSLAEYKEGLREKNPAFQAHMIIQRTRQPTAASYKSLGNLSAVLARRFLPLPSFSLKLFYLFIYLFSPLLFNTVNSDGLLLRWTQR